MARKPKPSSKADPKSADWRMWAEIDPYARDSDSEAGCSQPRGGTSGKAGFSSPFKDLKQMLKERAATLPTKPSPPSAIIKPKTVQGTSTNGTAAPIVDEAVLFQQAFADVRRLPNGRAERIVVAPEHKTEIVSEDAEVLAALSDLVSGQGKFELTESDEYVEGMRVGLDPRLVTRLRRGEFSVQAHIDLHGMFQADAKEKLTQFIIESVQKGLRAVLVVHGRGLRSPGGQPVLKHAAAHWLSHGVMGGYVLAFTTAQAYDGGAGAMWVLLRRERRRAKFDVMRGAKLRD
ncbi:MAG TPA: Smr/MutS family protein [Candidatus Binataceae bacterium]|nr:Smr/MutS family protein [Candidatus Binataceae bacterium]